MFRNLTKVIQTKMQKVKTTITQTQHYFNCTNYFIWRFIIFLKCFQHVRVWLLASYSTFTIFPTFTFLLDFHSHIRLSFRLSNSYSTFTIIFDFSRFYSTFTICFDFHNLIRLSQSYATFSAVVKVILCASEHICSIVRYCFRSFKQL